ncbi:hypothetical protein JCM10213_003464 [Rhodosporidiobolus nylandii]
MDEALPLPPVASTSAAAMAGLTVGAAGTQSEAGRSKRSRRDRPCDVCRLKQQCSIPVKGEACKTCKARGKACTFEAPPAVRNRKPKEAELPTSGLSSESAPATSASAIPASAAPELPLSQLSPRPHFFFAPRSCSSSWPASSSSESLLSLIRLARAPALPVAPSFETALEERLSPGGGRTELHFISSDAFSTLTFSIADLHNASYPGDVTFRQLSNDAAAPVFFVQTPALMYGTAAPSGERLWQAACAMLGPEVPKRLIELYLRQSQPAFPILDEQQFSSSEPSTLVSFGVSFGLLTSLLAHSTCYVTEIRQFHKPLWRQVLLALEDEYRKPTLQTLQLALIVITSRPAINVGQNTVAMGRIITAAQLLGLHLDPSHWRIPESEKVLRRRLWWAILITDKLRAAYYGRPSNVSLQDCNVRPPTLDDLASRSTSSPAQIASFRSFIAMCKLSLILDRVLTSFFTVRATTSPPPAAERLQTLELISFDLATLERELPSELQSLPDATSPTSEPASTGIRSFQLCKMGVSLIIYRLTASALENPSPAQQAASFRTALSHAQDMIEFLENLGLADCGSYWAPYCSFIISNAGALLIRVALATKLVDQPTRTTCGVLFTRLVVCLTSSHHTAQWDVASLALDRIATLLRSLDGELPELVPLLQLFGPPNHAADPPPSPATAPPAPPPVLPSLQASFTGSSHLSPSLATDHVGYSPSNPSIPLHSPTLAPPAGAPDPFAAPTYSVYRPPPHPSFPLAPPPPTAGPGAPAPPAAPADLTSPASASGAADSMWWMHTSIHPLPSHFEDLPDVLMDWGMGSGSETPGGAGAEGEEGAEGVFDLLRFLQGPPGEAGEGEGGT